jgi:hypothetical protein
MGANNMKSNILLMLGFSMIFTAGAVHAAEPLQMWNCGMEDGVTEADVATMATKWLEAARKIDGGENIEVAVLWPVVVNAAGETDFIFFMRMPTFSEWGRFWDAYPLSDIEVNAGGDTFCPDSVLWEFTKFE